MEIEYALTEKKYARVMNHCSALLKDEGYPILYIVPVRYSNPERGDHDVPGLYARVQTKYLFWDIPIEGKSPLSSAVYILSAMGNVMGHVKGWNGGDGHGSERDHVVRKS